MNCIDKVLDEANLLEIYNFEAGDNFFVAGGACTRLYFGAETLGSSDLDIYVSKPTKILVEDLLLSTSPFVLIRERGRVSTYLNPLSQNKIQLIGLHDYLVGTDSAQDTTLHSFDLTACQLAYTHGRLSGGSTGSIKLLEAGLLRITSYSFHNYQRLIKYLETYPLKLDLQDVCTISCLEAFREKCILGLNHTNTVQDSADLFDY